MPHSPRPPRHHLHPPQHGTIYLQSFYDSKQCFSPPHESQIKANQGNPGEIKGPRPATSPQLVQPSHLRGRDGPGGSLAAWVTEVRETSRPNLNCQTGPGSLRFQRGTRFGHNDDDLAFLLPIRMDANASIGLIRGVFISDHWSQPFQVSQYALRDETKAVFLG